MYHFIVSLLHIFGRAYSTKSSMRTGHAPVCGGGGGGGWCVRGDSVCMWRCGG